MVVGVVVEGIVEGIVESIVEGCGRFCCVGLVRSCKESAVAVVVVAVCAAVVH